MLGKLNRGFESHPLRHTFMSVLHNVFISYGDCRALHSLATEQARMAIQAVYHRQKIEGAGWRYRPLTVGAIPPCGLPRLGRSAKSPLLDVLSFFTSGPGSKELRELASKCPDLNRLPISLCVFEQLWLICLPQTIGENICRQPATNSLVKSSTRSILVSNRNQTKR